ncbi:DUF4293 domain-containing protein [Hymenobacter crusticola]|uniref:Transcription termination factor Rho n=1 Tax=Hymenobacter crusticola TaxID=1770526 RepID=A0A243W741_9BACT|nr:DUF4293 domain-containing protein [Hymenobacter crusticola]OUJ70222.1 hypothetical protein BXP70_25005 [Hymenobacter crusticola]
MIQRIQSVFLLLLAIAMASVIFVPIWSKTDALTGQELVLHATKLAFVNPASQTPAAVNTWPIAALAALSAAVALFEIFQYRSRFTQLKLGLVNLVLIAATIGASYYYSGVGEQMLNIKLIGTFEAGFYLPTLALILNLLANRFIRRDEQLVRSMDRLR